MKSRLLLFVMVIWWSSISVLGFWVVPMLFARLPTPAMAGNLAAQLFAQQGWLALVCGVVALLASRRSAAVRDGVPANPHSKAAVVWVLIALFAVIANQYIVSPHIVARENLRLWHGLGTALYAVQWLCVTAMLWRWSGHSAKA